MHLFQYLIFHLHTIAEPFVPTIFICSLLFASTICSRKLPLHVLMCDVSEINEIMSEHLSDSGPNRTVCLL